MHSSAITETCQLVSPFLTVQDCAREKHKPIKCQEQLTSACFTPHRLRKFYSMPIIKVNKNEYRTPQRPVSYAGFCDHNIQIFPPCRSLLVSWETPQRPGCFLFTTATIQPVRHSVLPLKIIRAASCWTHKGKRELVHTLWPFQGLESRENSAHSVSKVNRMASKKD